MTKAAHPEYRRRSAQYVRIPPSGGAGAYENNNRNGAQAFTRREFDGCLFRQAAENHEQQAGEQGGGRQREDPSQRDISNGTQMKPTVIRHHGAGNA